MSSIIKNGNYRNEDGVTAIEYAILCFFIAISSFTAIQITGVNLKAVFCHIDSVLGGDSDCSAASASSGNSSSGNSSGGNTSSSSGSSSGTSSGSSDDSDDSDSDSSTSTSTSASDSDSSESDNSTSASDSTSDSDTSSSSTSSDSSDDDLPEPNMAQVDEAYPDGIDYDLIKSMNSYDQAISSARQEYSNYETNLTDYNNAIASDEASGMSAQDAANKEQNTAAYQNSNSSTLQRIQQQFDAAVTNFSKITPDSQQGTNYQNDSYQRFIQPPYSDSSAQANANANAIWKATAAYNGNWTDPSIGGLSGSD